MRNRLFKIIDLAHVDDITSKVYDYLMIVVILASLIPLAFKNTNPFFKIINEVCCAVFVVDYILRLITADEKLKKGKVSFLLYPFTFMALIDLVSMWSRKFSVILLMPFTGHV